MKYYRLMVKTKVYKNIIYGQIQINKLKLYLDSVLFLPVLR